MAVVAEEAVMTAAEKEGADWDEYTRSELPLPGRVLVVDVIVRTAPAEYAGPSQTVMPKGVCIDDLADDGTVIGRRSVILDAMPSDDAVHFAPLQIVSITSAASSGCPQAAGSQPRVTSCSG